MYKLRPIFQLPETLSIKHHLYKMKPISEALNGNKTAGTETSNQDSTQANNTKDGIPEEVADLERRWQSIESRLSSLQSEIQKQATQNVPETSSSVSGQMPSQLGESSLVMALADQQEKILHRISELMASLAVLKSHQSLTVGPQNPLNLDSLEDCQKSLIQRIIELNEEIKLLTAALDNNNVSQVGGFQDLVITANPSRPPHSLKLIHVLLQQLGLQVYASTHVHSSVSDLPAELARFLVSPSSLQRSQAQLALTLIWKTSGSDEPALLVSPSTQNSAILGEANIARYLSRVLPALSPASTLPSAAAADELLDLTDYGSALGVSGSKRERPAALQKLEKKLSSSMLSGTQKPGIVDAVLYSSVLNAKLDLQKDLGKNVKNWVERCRALLPSNNPKVSTSKYMSRSELEQLLRSLDIEFKVLEHPEVYTVAAMMEHVTVLPGYHTKNLFVKDKKKGTLYLITARHDVPVNLSQLAKLLGSKELRFAEENVLFDKLGVKQGCVTPFALVNDKSRNVVFVIDAKLVESDDTLLNCHPLSNAATANLTAKDFKKFLERTGHQPVTVQL